MPQQTVTCVLTPAAVGPENDSRSVHGSRSVPHVAEDTWRGGNRIVRGLTGGRAPGLEQEHSVGANGRRRIGDRAGRGSVVGRQNLGSLVLLRNKPCSLFLTRSPLPSDSLLRRCQRETSGARRERCRRSAATTAAVRRGTRRGRGRRPSRHNGNRRPSR